MKRIVTVTGIRPDFIRMSKVFERLDAAFEHTMIHTGQHYDDELSQIFFRDLSIRRPDFTLETGRSAANHYEQLSYLSKEIIYLLQRERIEPDLVIFLGDSNSVLSSIPLFKEGYRIGHIEGGMRSYDRRMPEEVNRVCCDYVSDYVFVYTSLYKERLLKENKDPAGIFVVGNTITEVVLEHMPTGPRRGGYFLADIHRNENLRTVEKFDHILTFLNEIGQRSRLPVKLVRFPRSVRMIEENHLLDNKPRVELCGPYGFLEFLQLQYHSEGMISDSGTAQEECPLLGVPVVVPRNATERPESLHHGNSILVGESAPTGQMVDQSLEFFASYQVGPAQLEWLGRGDTSTTIAGILRDLPAKERVAT